MNKSLNETILKLIDIYLIQNKYTLTEFQQEVLDYFDIESSISFGENDIEEYIEVYGDTTIKVNTKGEILNGE